MHFYFERPPSQFDSRGFNLEYDWNDKLYSDFMIQLLRSLEPRLFEAGEYIFEEGDEIDEHLYVIRRDPLASPNSSG